MGCCILGALAIAELIVVYQTLKRHSVWVFAAAGALAASLAVAWVLLFSTPTSATAFDAIQMTCRSSAPDAFPEPSPRF